MAPQLEIYVDGQGSSFRTAERGYLRLNISSTRTNQSQAVQEVQGAVAKLTSTVRALATKNLDGSPHPEAAVTAFTVAPLSTVSQFQRDEHYRQLPDRPKEYTVSASAEIIFRNMARLADVSDEFAQMPYVSSETEWRLTDATRAELEREARRKAIADAVQKAQDYAGVVGRRVVAVEIKDQHQASGPGLFYRQPMAQQGMMQQQMQMAQAQAQAQALQRQQQMAQQATQGSVMSTAASEALMLEPKTITVSARVSVKFVSADRDGNGDSMED